MPVHFVYDDIESVSEGKDVFENKICKQSTKKKLKESDCILLS